MEKGAKNVKNVRDKIAIPELMTLDKLLEVEKKEVRAFYELLRSDQFFIMSFFCAHSSLAQGLVEFDLHFQKTGT